MTWHNQLHASESPGGTAAASAGATVRGGPGAGAGEVLIAGALAMVAALLLRLILNVPTPAELFGDRVTVLIPLPAFSALLDLFGTSAKHLFFIGLLVAEWLCGVLAGLMYLRLRLVLSQRGAISSRLGSADPLALALWLAALALGVLAPLLGGGLLGSALPGGAGAAVVSQVGPNLVFGFALRWLSGRVPGSADRMQDAAYLPLSRRRLLGQGATALAIVTGGMLAWEAASSGLGSLFGLSRPHVASVALAHVPTRISPPPVPEYGTWADVHGLTPEVTSAANFYYVSKNLAGDPRVASSSWRLAVTGAVASPYSLSYDELLSLPRVERYQTLECISNEVGGNLISNARFTGTRLADVLNRAGIKPPASELVFHASDGYSDSLHLSTALNPEALIVYLLNGAPLPQAHGFPARLLVPGLYGMKNGKWLTSLELGTGGYEGYWEQQGWTREARVKIMSRIDLPRDGDLLAPRQTAIAGIAYTGDHGVARVDVSTDGGRTWNTATLRRPLGALTWVLWEYPWTPTPGHSQIVVRAIDLQGNVQSPAYAAPLPDGSSGYHAVNVSVG